jgi:hypothetical protein
MVPDVLNNHSQWLPDPTDEKHYLFTYLLTYSMEQSPSWETNRFAASQEIPRILLNPKVHYSIHKCPPPVSILSQLNPVNTPHHTSWRSILILSPPSMPGSPQWSLPLRFPHQNPVHDSPLPHLSYMPRPSHSSRFYHPHNSGWGVPIMKLLWKHYYAMTCHVLFIQWHHTM